jgi:fucose 4-O-acetylase-like acetyltransferase
MTMTTSEGGDRDIRLDYAKAIGIILVVYGHVARGLITANMPGADQPWMQAIDRIIYSFHMPLFFLLSGLSFRESLLRRGSRGLLLGKVDTIVYPYVVWSLIQGLTQVALSRVTNAHASLAEASSFLWHPIGQFWFLFFLMAIFLLATAVSVLSRGVRPWLLIAIFGVLYLAFRDDRLTYGAFYFSCGVVFDRHREVLWQALRRCTTLLGLVVVALQLAWVANRDPHSTDIVPAAIDGVVALFAIAFVLGVTTHLAQRRSTWLADLGRQSMSIYVMHIIAGSGARIVMVKFMGIHGLPMHLVVGTLAGIALPLATQLPIVKRRLPFLLTPPGFLSVSRFTRRDPRHRTVESGFV